MLGKLLTFLASAAFLVLLFSFSLLLFAVLAAFGLLAWGYLWWKTRELRRRLRERAPDAAPDGRRGVEGEVIEGEAPRRVTDERPDA